MFLFNSILGDRKEMRSISWGKIIQEEGLLRLLFLEWKSIPGPC